MMTAWENTKFKAIVFLIAPVVSEIKFQTLKLKMSYKLS